MWAFHPVCPEAIPYAKQINDRVFSKRRTGPWCGLLLALMSWLPGGSHGQVVGVHQPENSQNTTAELSCFQK